MNGTDMLPVQEIAGAVNDALKRHGVLIVTAPPGAGKSTLLPLTILEGLPSGGRILMLEPRRVAARQIAGRMASMLGEQVGETVGYRIRFERRISERTRIEVLTEGMLTRRLIDDPTLEGVSVVIFDEFHERSLASDEAVAMTRQARELLRDDLRIVLMSATIDTSALSEALSAPVIESRGRMYPVELVRCGQEALPENAAEMVAKTVREAHASRSGDILAFLPGEADIRRCAVLLGDSLGATRICPLYGMQPDSEQQAALAPCAPGERKVVLATPIAETSLTIEGIRIVVDSGLCRKSTVDARSGLSRLETVRISADMAAQRAGRAGRVAPGVCYRLWNAGTEARMPAVRTPEILEADLSSLALDVAAWGERDVSALPWLTPPPSFPLRTAAQLLVSLGALAPDGSITPHGRTMAKWPCHPRIAQMLLQGPTPKLKALAADIAAIVEEKDVLSETDGAGLDVRINALRMARASGHVGKWARVERSSWQYRKMVAVSEDNASVDPYEVGGLLASAYPERIGRSLGDASGRYQLSGGGSAALGGNDPLCAAQWIVAASLNARVGAAGRIFLACPVAEEDLLALASERDVLYWDGKAGALVARKESRIGVHLLAEKALSDVPREELLRVICQAAVKEGLSMFDFSEDVRGLQRRIAAASAWHPEWNIPDVGTDALLASADSWLPAFIGDAKTSAQLKKIDMKAVIWSLLPYEMQQMVERAAPSHIEVPTGSRIALDYRLGADAPVLRVRLQECFGMLDTPRVDGGRLAVLMELLSPGYKPVQLTSDLRSFWENAYFEVRKELRRRYPKHAWPDRPMEAEPVRGAKRRSLPENA
ncbi:MAG: ATP-dependent helicase HrpB [Bacteroidales bacterium]|nr:ATP-dependent helicase HrpB [Bacteroidales bacterium]